MILQNFDLQATDPSYVMKFRQTLTIKPIGFTMHARLRGKLDSLALERRLWGGKDPQMDEVKAKHAEGEEVRKSGQPLKPGLIRSTSL